MYLNAITLFFQTSRWFSEGLKNAFLWPLSYVWRGQAFLEEAQNASKLDFVLIICIWMCISKGSSAHLPYKTNHLHSFKIHHLSLKPNSKCNQWELFKTCLGLGCPSLEAPDRLFLLVSWMLKLFQADDDANSAPVDPLLVPGGTGN